MYIVCVYSVCVEYRFYVNAAQNKSLMVLGSFLFITSKPIGGALGYSDAFRWNSSV